MILLRNISNYFYPQIMNEKFDLTLHYRGGEADTGEMDYRMIAYSILAFGDLVEIMSNTSWKDAKIETKIKSVSPTGSFEVVFALSNVIGITQTLLMPNTPDNIWDLLKDCIVAWKFLKGFPPINRKTEGNNVTIKNNYGNVNIFNQCVFNAATHSKAGTSAEKVFKNPMERGNISEIAIETNNDNIIIPRKDRGCFKDISSISDKTEKPMECILTIESVRFSEEKKWYFSHEKNKLYAAIEDKKFWEKIDNGEPFSKGDALNVDLCVTQGTKDGKPVIEYKIVKVKDHFRNKKGRQLSLNN